MTWALPLKFTKRQAISMSRKLKTIALFTAAGLLTQSTNIFAWNATGHIIVAQIAYNHLTPVAKQDVDYLIQQTDFGKTFPQFTPYVYSAPWPDYLNYDLKEPEGDAKDIDDFLRIETKSWHYTDDPIVIGDYHPAAESVSNAIWAIQYLIPNLSELLKAKEYTMAAYDLVFITHIVGDIHQPLHGATLFDADFPDGDRGGNLYKIKSGFHAKELHAAWDDSLGQFAQWEKTGSDEYHPPLDKIQATANQIESSCDDTAAQNTNPTDWEKESHQIAENFVYPIKNADAPQINELLSERYVKDGQAIADQRLCLAGKRLATILNAVFTKPIDGVTQGTR
jgi:hypothetical protein